MVKNKFLSQKYEHDMYAFNIDYTMCFSMDNKEELLVLKHPKIIHMLSNINTTGPQQSIDINETIPNVDQQKLPNGNKFDKRNKVSAKQEDIIEARKNKVKFKKKLRNKIAIDKNDLLLVKNSNEVLNEDSLDIAIIKQPRNNKNRKKIKLKQNAFEYNSQDSKNQSVDGRIDKNIIIDSPLSIQELAIKLNMPEAEIITWLFLKGISVTINQVIDIPMATEVAANYDFNVLNSASSADSNYVKPYDASMTAKTIKRPPVITILGHVDHGKTTLLDAIRSSDLVKQEVGGITQAIAGYEVNWSYNSATEKLIFLDTPGHEAFSSMRLRGTQVTDIVLLVVAADDGLKPQTIESIRHIKNHELPCIVAINKIDKHDINVFKVKEELAQYNIFGEDWGGDTPIIEISALLGKNIDILLSNICLLSELQELKANPLQLAQGTILEAHLDKAKGPVANIIVQNGTLKVGDIIASHNTYGKVKAIMNSLGVKIDQADPSSIVELWGFSNVPQAGAAFNVLDTEKEAKQVVSKHRRINDNYSIYKTLNSRVTLDTYNKTANLKQLNLIIKADTQGSIEAIINSFSQISQEKVQINIIAASSGNISDTDIDLAMTSNSLVIAFNSRIPLQLVSTAEKLSIVLCSFSIIYDLLDYIQLYMLNLIDPEYEKQLIGTAIVQTVFDINKGSVAGCLVSTGKLKQDAAISVYRQDQIVYDGFLNSLKRIKDNVAEVSENNECGVMCNDYNLWQKQDIIKAYELKEKIKTL
uniref:Translation initiation factor IF-2, chloroplastic n=1 Tax=Grateloupia filicina TaxID=31455 RepID=A0A2S1FWW6_9FLOR|nr:translation initiation factor IF-2 [Grateloupia filicina]AWD77259.1 translation initiation factor IF-2 [Grateloupia filicina]